jgi:hypothetical protein
MLTRRQPFQGKSTSDLARLIATVDPLPPRQCNEQIPQQLERICLKAIAKRASERYPTARDLVDDLRHYLAQPIDRQMPAMFAGE